MISDDFKRLACKYALYSRTAEIRANPSISEIPHCFSLFLKDRPPKEIGLSIPLSSFCDKMYPIAVVLASVVIMKGLFRFGYPNNGVVDMTDRNASKAV